jgi:hypothetical protein
MKKLQELKTEYNYWLARNNKAEEYFNTHTEKECFKYLDLFYSITIKLSELIKKIQAATGEEMSDYEILNGFK